MFKVLGVLTEFSPLPGPVFQQFFLLFSPQGLPPTPTKGCGLKARQIGVPVLSWPCLPRASCTLAESPRLLPGDCSECLPPVPAPSLSPALAACFSVSLYLAASGPQAHS